MIRRQLLVLALVVVVVAAAAVAAALLIGSPSSHATVTTTGGYSFAAYGDIRPDPSAPNASYGPGFRHVMDKLGAMPHAFDVVMGDIIQNASGRYTLAHTEMKYDNMLSQLGPDARFPHVWVVGNHEGVQTQTGSQAFAAKLHSGPHWYTYS